MKIKMGTRGSALALAQSGWVARELRRLRPEFEIEVVVIKTSGDVFASASPQDAHQQADGTKGLFIKEIEEALAARAVDFAVHSAKDLPARLADGLRVAAYPKREDPRDVFIGRGGVTFSTLTPGAVLATSSLRRQIQLRRHAAGVNVAPMRGNVDTRLRKLEEGAADGIILAAAGLKRLGRESLATDPIPLSIMLPAPGQGALAIETRQGKGAVAQAVAALDDGATRLAVEFERAFLAAVGGGCSTPLAALAEPGPGLIRLSVFWAREDGGGAARLSETCSDPSRRDEFCADLARRVRSES